VAGIRYEAVIIAVIDLKKDFTQFSSTKNVSIFFFVLQCAITCQPEE